MKGSPTCIVERMPFLMLLAVPMASPSPPSPPKLSLAIVAPWIPSRPVRAPTAMSVFPTPDADAVIVELGANDALRGVDPAITRKAMGDIMARLDERGIPVLLAGMRAPPNLGHDYVQAFEPIYSDLAESHGALLYPFFLDGVAARPGLNQADGIHPTADGVDIIVERILPSVEELIERVGEETKSGALHPGGQQPMLPVIRDGGASCRACSPA